MQYLECLTHAVGGILYVLAHGVEVVDEMTDQLSDALESGCSDAANLYEDRLVGGVSARFYMEILELPFMQKWRKKWFGKRA